MAADKIRVGIIGANAHDGWSMRAHLPALRAMPDYELTAVCTSRPETAAESAAHYGARLAFHDYHAMVRHPDIDLVSVSVRVPLHHDMVMVPCTRASTSIANGPWEPPWLRRKPWLP